MALTTFSITNDGQFLIVTSSVGAEESINLDSIKDVSCINIISPPGTYPYDDMNMVTVEINGREADLTFDLAAVTNQPTWTLDQAGCNQAQADIRGWLASVAGGAGLATEATLNSVLNAIVASDQDIEILLVRDTVTLEVFQQITNYETGTPVVEYKDVDGNIIPQPLPNPIEYLDPSAVLQLILNEALAQGLTLDSINAILDRVDGRDGVLGAENDGLRVMGRDSTGKDWLLRTTEVGRLEVTMAGASVLPLPTGAATEATLDAINSVNQDILTGVENIDINTTPSVRSYTTVVSSGVGNVPAGSRRGSMFNSGNAAGTWNGASIPAGFGVPFAAGGENDTLPIINFDATGTTFIIEYTS